MKVPVAIKRKAAALRREIDEHNRRYYVLSAPTISDAEFDEKFKELEALESSYPALRTPDSPTQKVGSGVLGGLPVVKLRRPMLSLPSLFTQAEVEAFDSRVKALLGKSDIEYVAELKFDGVAINLSYEKGVLAQAALRGTGTEGEDVTENARWVSGIPHELHNPRVSRKPRLLEVRGEVVMTKSDFRALNQSLEVRGKKRAVNPRNAASGALRQFRVADADRKRLTFFAYGLGEVEGFAPPKAQSEYWELFRGFGFGTSPERAISNSLVELFAFFHLIEGLRDTIDFDIDGVVYKVNSVEDQEKLGEIGKDVRWAVAHKFKAETKQTRLLKVEFQVGRTGVLTPVAKLDPVFVGQAQVSNATLHNERQIREKGVYIGDLVWIRRAGDVIPEVVGVAEVGASRSPIRVPDTCPVCESHVERNEDGTSAWCTGGLICSAQLKQRILHFCGKRAMNVDGIGAKLVDVLVDELGVEDLAGIYKLPSLISRWLLETCPRSRLMDVLPGTSRKSPLLDRFSSGLADWPETTVEGALEAKDNLFWNGHDGAILLMATVPRSPDDLSSERRRRLGEKDATSLLGQINRSKKIPFHRFLFALGIRHIGEEMAMRLSSKGHNWDDLCKMKWGEELSKKEQIQKENAKRKKSGDPLFVDSFPGMGPEIIGSLRDFFGEPSNLKVAEEILRSGVELVYDSTPSTGPLAGQSFLFTGTLSRSRDVAENEARSLGARILGGVSRNLSYLVVGKNPGDKLARAQELGVEILDEAGFDRLIAQNRQDKK